MSSPPTVIARFLLEVTRELRSREANGAAERVWRAGATFEPRDRAARTRPEQQRLLLLADRASRHWVPTTIQVLRDDGLADLARQLPAIRNSRDADHAAQLLGDVRDRLRHQPNGPLAATPAGVASALAPLQTMLRHIATGDETRPQATASLAVPHGARGLVACFLEGAPFSDGIPGEVRATVQVLDALDDEHVASWGSPALERTENETDLHRTLVASLMSRMALEVGEITHAESVGTLPLPATVGRHRPDVAGRTATGELFLGEAKLGPELFDDHSQEQLADFLGFAPDGDRVALHLIVPRGWRVHAERAAATAAAQTDTLVVHEVGGLIGAPTPL